MERVVVTGMGLISCLGTELDEVSANLRAGRSKIVLSPERKEQGFRSGLMTKLPPLDFKAELDRKSRKFMPEVAMFGAMAANRAIASAQLEPEQYQQDDVGIIVGNDSAAKPIPHFMDVMDQYKETRFLGSAAIIHSMNSSISMNLGPFLGARGINMSISSACASGAHAIGQGTREIRSGRQRMIFAGGCQEDSWLGAAAFDAINALSVHEHDPTCAVRPFDSSRDGLVPGVGGAMLVIESLTSALARGAPIFGEVIGYGVSSDGGHLTMPTGDGARRAMTIALKDAGISPGDVDYINAHATGTPAGDRAEAGAIQRLFGKDGPPVSSTKAMTGHECWMGGASEAIYSLLMMRDGFLAPNCNFESFDKDTPSINVIPKVVETDAEIIISNSFGFGGTNATLVLRRWTN